jgi:hypothetical protein
VKSCLTSALFWPSANCLAWRVATGDSLWREGGCIPHMSCVCKTRRRRAIHFLKLHVQGYLEPPRAGDLPQIGFEAGAAEGEEETS